METLKSLVIEVESFLAGIAHSVTRDVKDDIAIAMKGIVAVRKPPKPKPKPAVKMDDNIGYLCDDYEHSVEGRNDISSEADLHPAIEGVRIGYDDDVDEDKENSGDMKDSEDEDDCDDNINNSQDRDAQSNEDSDNSDDSKVNKGRAFWFTF